jgi:hypothetical protein
LASWVALCRGRAEAVSKPGECVWESGRVTEPEPHDDVSGDVLAEKLLAVQRSLAALNADSEVRIRLNFRFMAICTSLKMPGASRVRGLRRLDELMADAELAGGDAGDEV